MSTIELRKRSDAGQRWVAHWIWVQEGYWKPDPIDNDKEIPNEPIDGLSDTQGRYITYKSAPVIPNSFIYGLIPIGYVYAGVVFLAGPYTTIEYPYYYYQWESVTWYEPAYET